VHSLRLTLGGVHHGKRKEAYFPPQIPVF
jgi:hypothetical protein